MAFSVYPVGANTGFSEESALDSEKDRLIAALGGRMANFVVLPFSQNHFNLTNPSGLDAEIAAGDAFTGGHLVRSDTAETRTLSASTTSEVFLVVDDAETNNAAIIAQDKATADPTGQFVVKLWEATTDGSTITGTTDFRPYVPFRDGNAVADSVTGRKSGESGTIGVASTGVKTVAVSFAQPYRTALDDVQLTLNSLSDTAVTFGFVRAINRTVDGFTIQASVTTAGASGSTATFDWATNGK